MPLNVCVFCSSSDVIEPTYFAAASELGTALASRRDTLIYGGTNVGLMGAVARAVHQHGGRVVGVIPSFIAGRGLAYSPADELIVTRDMRERKARMEERADVFVALPGGFGTLEEMLEIVTLKQLQQHTKAVIFLNVDGFYDRSWPCSTTCASTASPRHMRTPSITSPRACRSCSLISIPTSRRKSNPSGSALPSHRECQQPACSTIALASPVVFKSRA